MATNHSKLAELIEKYTPHVYGYYAVCERKAWLAMHRIEPGVREGNANLARGRFLDESAHRRSNPLIEDSAYHGLKPDRIWRENSEAGERDRLVVGEVKVSSKRLEVHVLQTMCYLVLLEEIGEEARGEVLVPRENKRIEVHLNDENNDRLEQVTIALEHLSASGRPPSIPASAPCKSCAYVEQCWS